MNDRVNEHIGAWIGKADNKLKNAELVLAAWDENRPYDPVCFHCQHRWFSADGALRESSYDKLMPPRGMCGSCKAYAAELMADSLHEHQKGRGIARGWLGEYGSLGVGVVRDCRDAMVLHLPTHERVYVR